MRLSLRSFGFAAAAAFAAGCAGAQTSPEGSGLPGAVPAARTDAPQSVHMTIRIPKRSRRPRYISPATQSIAIAILKGPRAVVNETVNLTATSSGCTSSFTSTFCTLTIFIGAGHYRAKLTTYDGINGTGNALSTAQGFTFTVKPGEKNTIGLTLDGIPAKILVMSAGTNAVYALAQDADGNFIVGAGAPAFTASTTSGPAVAAIVQPTASQPNLIAVAQAMPAVSGFETIGVNAGYPKGTNACTERDAVCSAPSAITASYETQLFVANYAGDNVSGFAVPLGNATQSPDVAIDFPHPNRLAADTHGNVFATSFQVSGGLWEFSPPYASATQLNAEGVDAPHGIALDTGGNVYIANTYGNTIAVFDAPYTGAPLVITKAVSGPNSVVVDSSGTLYSANSTSSTIAAYAPPTFSAAPVTASTASSPLFLTLESGTLYVGEASNVEAFALPLTNGEKPAITLSSGIANVNDLTFDGGGNLYVANNTGGLTGAGSIEEFANPISSGASPLATATYANAPGTLYGPFSLAFGPGGYLYVVDLFGGSGAGGIDEYAMPLTSSSTPLLSLSTSAFNSPYSQAFGTALYAVTP